MKLVRKNKKINTYITKQSELKPSPWKILIVDDELDIHIMSRLALDDFEFAGKKLQIFQAMSAIEAREILVTEPDIAVALIDVVMETDDAGLRLVDFIRNQLKYSLIRLIIRTGQPGIAPEKDVIERYDIDDYKDKADLTADKLYITMLIALKSYRDLNTLDGNRKALSKIIEAAPELYHPQSLGQFFKGVLTQMIGLCNLGGSFNAIISHGFVVTIEDHHQIVIQASMGRFTNQNAEIENIVKRYSERVLQIKFNELLPSGELLIPLKVHNQSIGFIYLEEVRFLKETHKNLIHIMVNQCTSALENLQLYHDLKEANQQVSQMLFLAEQAREMAETANRAKSTFLAKMSHELRTPLTAIIGYSDLIQEESLDLGYKEILPDLEKIQTSGKQLLTLISDILDLSKIEADKLELHKSQFMLDPLIEEIVVTILPLVNKKGNCFNVKSENELGLIYTDYQKLKQILLNLLSNAAKFTQQGTIDFNITREKRHPILKETDNQNTVHSSLLTPSDSSEDWLYFQVVDSGVGIAPDKLKGIFDPFIQADDSTTREFGGSGLGLTISNHFCQAMGGSISVCSTFGKGATFTLKLPVNRQ